MHFFWAVHMSSRENILRFIIFFLRDSVTQISEPKTPHHFLSAKAIKWLAQGNISPLSVASLAWVPAKWRGH